MPDQHQCPSCGAPEMEVFYELNQVPVHSVQILRSREDALNFPTGDIALAFCHSCGFISNIKYNPALQDYSIQYESTQGYSPTFNSFARRLAKHLIDRYDLHDKDIIEIGCGQGEFLTLLCEMGNNRGLGFDPAFTGARIESEANQHITFISDYYSEKYADRHADFICCKMTLEHIQDTANFMQIVRRSVGDNQNTVIFFQIPSVNRVLKDRAFWDIYYEHCSYFSPGSLARLFRAAGFDVMALWTDYDDQYLMIEARPGGDNPLPALPEEDSPADLWREVQDFSRQVSSDLAGWKEQITAYCAQGKKVVLWGSGSKGVAFLTTLGLNDEIEFTVDINPYKNNTYMAITGQKVVPPTFLKEYTPDIVILMNPIYHEEVRQDLNRMGLHPELLGLGT